MPGFTFVGREAEVSTFRQLLERPQGELLVVAGPEACGKSHLLRRLRGEAERQERHFVQLCSVGHLPDPELGLYAVLRALAVAHQHPPSGGEAGPVARLVPSPGEFFDHLMRDDPRPPAERLVSVFAAASSYLSAEARFVLLLDLGRTEGKDPFPVAFLARRLPDKVKLVVAAPGVPEGLEGLDTATVLPDLAPFSEAEVTRLLDFHRPRWSAVQALVGPILVKFAGHPLLTDVAAKLVSGSRDPLAALADLPSTPHSLCEQLLARLSDEQRRVVHCVAEVPSGVDTATLCALLTIADLDARRVLLSDEVRSIVLTLRCARGINAHVFHESCADLFGGDTTPQSATFHRRVAAYFLGVAHKDPHDVEAIAAHSHHIRLSGDRAQFIQDFPRALRAKQQLGLWRLLAQEYQMLLLWCGKLGEGAVNRPLCMAALAQAYERLGQRDDALHWHRDAFNVYQEMKDTSNAATQLAQIAAVLRDRGQLGEALQTLRRAIPHHEAAGPQAALAADLSSEGELHEQLGQLDDALRCHERALELYRETHNDPAAGAELAQMAGIHIRRGDHQAARASYQEAWRLHNRSGSALAEVEDLAGLGRVFEALGDMEKATACTQQAIELCVSTPDRKAEAAHRRALAAMHLEAGQVDEAVRALQQAVAVARSSGDPEGEAEGLIQLAGTQLAAGQTALARQLLDQAIALTTRLGDAEAQDRARAALQRLERPAGPDGAPAPDEAPQEPPLELAPTTHPEIPVEPAADGADQEDLFLPVPDASEPPAPGPEPIALPSPTDDSPAAEVEAEAEGEDLIAKLQGELEAAERRIATLEADKRQLEEANRRLDTQLKEYQQLVASLRALMGQGPNTLKP